MIGEGNMLCDRRIKSRDYYLSDYLCLYLFISVQNMSIKTAFFIGDGAKSFISISLFMILGLYALYLLRFIAERGSKILIILESTFIIAYSLTFLRGTADESILADRAFTTLIICIPMATIVYEIENMQILYERLLKYSYYVFFFLLLSLLSVGRSRENAYSMSISYAVLPFIFVQFLEAIANRKLKNAIISLFFMIYEVLFGARGGLLCIIFFVSIYALRGKKWNKYIYIGILILLFCLVNDKSVMNYISNWLSGKNMYSYIFTKLIDNSLFESNSRAYLFKYYLDISKVHPIFGWGLFGGWIENGLGPHNGLIECVVQFGYFGGAIAIILILYCFIKVILTYREADIEDIMLLIFCSCCFSMLISAGEILSKPMFFIFISLACRNRNNRRHSMPYARIHRSSIAIL